MDSIVSSVITKFEQRSEMGKKKYGTDLDRTDLSTQEWINHAQEELMDGILYLEKLKQEDVKLNTLNNTLSNEKEEYLRVINNYREEIYKHNTIICFIGIICFLIILFLKNGF